jgi:hypothetical protein
MLVGGWATQFQLGQVAGLRQADQQSPTHGVHKMLLSTLLCSTSDVLQEAWTSVVLSTATQ